MACDLIFEPEAELDLQQAVKWYNEQRPGLGRDLVNCVDELLDRIRETPEIHPVIHRSARLALVKRFPYVICYVLDGNTIYVMAVFHGHRDPKAWQDRLS